MGVPKFFRWISERYTKVNQRMGRISNPNTIIEHYGEPKSASSSNADNTTTTTTTNPSSTSLKWNDLVAATATTATMDGDDIQSRQRGGLPIPPSSISPVATAMAASLIHQQQQKEQLQQQQQSLSSKDPTIPLSSYGGSTSSTTMNSNTKLNIYNTNLIPTPDPLSTCSSAPPIDRLYIDMNGIIHGCSHNNNSGDTTSSTTATTTIGPNGEVIGADDIGEMVSETISIGISEEEIFTNICFYLDRIIKDLVQPGQLVYMAIDGVAPRAKLNQQRSRRYRSGKEGLIEQTIYDAHLKQLEAQKSNTAASNAATNAMLTTSSSTGTVPSDNNQHITSSSSSPSDNVHSMGSFSSMADADPYTRTMTSQNNSSSTKGTNSSTTGKLFIEVGDDDDGHHQQRGGSTNNNNNNTDVSVREIEPGRFAGKFLAHLDDLGVGGHTNNKSWYSEQKSNNDSAFLSKLRSNIFSGGRVDLTNNTAASESNNTIDGTISNFGDTESTLPEEPEHVFHSNSITPGTPFFSRCTKHIEHFIQRKISDDPAWQHLTIIFSGPNVPGEGEHKILQFMREQKCHYEQNVLEGKTPSLDENPLHYHPNLRHCIMGQDGDLIMLGLLTHEPNLCLLREKVIFEYKSEQQQQQQNPQQQQALPVPTATALQSYVLNPNFELLHMNVLRDYFAYEFETSNVLPDSKWCLEHCIDDFVFMTFFVGNDFLPHMPAVDIADEAFDLLFYTYRDQRKKWLKDKTKKPYLTDQGTIISGSRLEAFLQVLGKHETPYLEYKKSTDDSGKARELEAKYGMSTIPSDEARAAKEAADRALFRERIERKVSGIVNGAITESDSGDESNNDLSDDDLDESNNNSEDDEVLQSANVYPDFQPVLSAATLLQQIKENNEAKATSKSLSVEVIDEDEDAEALSERMGGLLRYSVGGKDVHISDEDLKGRYYSDKFGFSPFDAEKHLALRKAYIEGLVWNLKYYYEGCVSWEWFYPYHYGPMLSDLVGIDSMLNEISFEGKMGKPLRPFEQLMACMPPSFAEVLPEPYREFMTDPKSPIADFYPQSFTIDMNGKRWPWEAVVLLPFIDSKRLLDTVQTIDESTLTDDERSRNTFGGISVFQRDPNVCYSLEKVGEGNMFTAVSSCRTKRTPYESTPFNVGPFKEKPIFKPKLLDGLEHPLPGYPTLRDGTVCGMWRKVLRVNIHGTKSRYKTACLEIENPIPEVLPVETIAEHLVGTLLWINYPHFVEAFVTAISDSKGIIRGKTTRKAWNDEDAAHRKKRLAKIVDSYVSGEKLVGTGGMTLAGGGNIMDTIDVLLYVRPFSGLKKLSDGTWAKTYAKFEIEVPLFVTGWAPQRQDSRIDHLPLRLEKDPYHAAKFVLTDKRGDENKSPVLPLKNSIDMVKTQRKYILFNRYNNKAQAYHTLCDRHFPTVVAPFMKSAMPAPSFHPTSGYATILPRRNSSNCSKLPSMNMILRHGNGSNQSRHSRSFFAVGLAISLWSYYFVGGTHAIFSDIVDSQSEFTSFGSTIMSHPIAHNIDKITTSRSLFDVSLLSESSLSENGIPSTPRNIPKATVDNTNVPSVNIQFAHGTTTCAFVYKGGIIIAVDSRASLGTFIGSKTTHKVLPIHSHMIGTMAGGAADCMIWIRKIRSEAMHYELTWNRRMSVSCASRILANALYNNRQYNLSIGSMIVGYDTANNDTNDNNIDVSSIPKIYYVDSSGMRVGGDCFAVGSGSVLALGILDNSSKRRYDMTRDEAIALGIRAIRHATARDAYSGGFINVYHMDPIHGYEHVFAQDMDAFSVAEY